MIKTDIQLAESERPASPGDAAFEAFEGELRRFIQDSVPSGFGPARDDSDEHEARFRRLALALFSLQHRAVGPLFRLCQRRGIAPQDIADWRAIPALPTTAFKDYAVTSLHFEARTRVFHSSGTTGHRPSRHFHSAGSLAVYEASLLPFFRAHLMVGAGQGKGEFTFLALTPDPSEAPHSSLAHMFATVIEAWGADDSAIVGAVECDGGWRVDTAASIALLRRCARNRRPVCVLGTAFAFVHLLDALHEDRLQCALPPGSRALETGGYKGLSRSVSKPDLHRLIGAALGIAPTHIVSEYGMSELSSQAYDACVPASPPARGAVDQRARGAASLTAAPGVETGDRRPGEGELRPSAAHAAGARAPGPGHGRVFHFPPWARSVVVSPEDGIEVQDGETGLLRVFDLANVRSVLAIQTEDLAVRRGTGFELVGRAPMAEPRGCSLQAVALTT
ncbi:MAG TPA: hypothetical protein PK640_07005 [Verrucomicrobiota bacterium]|nr:hypothetical protein [Verrucomicrobiota bacterium]